LDLVSVWWERGDDSGSGFEAPRASGPSCRLWLTFFSLAFIGSINAALPARKKLQELGFLESELGCSFSFYDLDTDKNVLDYLTFLKISSTNNDFEQNRAYNVRHFFYPTVLLCSLVTTAFVARGITSHRGCYRLLDGVHVATNSLRMATFLQGGLPLFWKRSS